VDHQDRFTFTSNGSLDGSTVRFNDLPFKGIQMIIGISNIPPIWQIHKEDKCQQEKGHDG
jgi:hypothetical protein